MLPVRTLFLPVYLHRFCANTFEGLYFDGCNVPKLSISTWSFQIFADDKTRSAVVKSKLIELSTLILI